jgi:hypothetical protein
MNKAQIEAVVAANAGALGLAIAAEHKAGVATFFALAAEMAQLVDGLALGHEDESGSIFVPVSPREAS